MRPLPTRLPPARPLATLRRLLFILRILLRHAVAQLVARRLARPGVSAARRAAWLRRVPLAAVPAPVRLRRMMEDLGGSFVKLGQMLALQPDILPLAYCNELFDLLDRIEPIPWEAAERVFVEEHGVTPDEVFDSIDRRPLATASVGQVHVAYLDGAKVAVKIQRPAAQAEFGQDVRLIVAATTLVRRLRLRPFAWLLEPLGEFVAWTEEELDYRYESRYAQELAVHSAASRIQRVPRVEPRFTSRRVLVVEFLEGTTLLDYLRARESGDEVLLRRVAAAGFEPGRFAANVIDNFLDDAFRHGVYHADLHPANLMILPENVVGYVDFGITGVMSHHGRRHLVAMTLALASGDLDTLHHHYLRVTAHGPKADFAGFRRGLDELGLQWYVDEGGRRLVANFTRIMSDMLHLSRRKQVLPERDIVKYIRSSIAIDGLITRFAPDFDVGAYLAASCSRFLRWQARKAHLRPALWLEGSSAGSRLVRTGPRRAVLALDRLLDREARRRRAGRTPTDRGAGARALELGAAACCIAALAALTGRPGPPGLDLWTAEVAFVAAAVLGTLRSAWSES